MIFKMPHGKVAQESVQHHDIGARPYRDVVKVYAVDVDFWHRSYSI